MIMHKESILIARDATNIEVTHDAILQTVKKSPRPSSTTIWSISISGDLESDDPKNAAHLLEELQEQVAKIRAAYA